MGGYETQVVAALDGSTLPQPTKVVCLVGNYHAHAIEMGGTPPQRVTYFLKPTTALAHSGQRLLVPRHLGVLHHEVELAVMVGTTLRDASEATAGASVIGAGVLIDLSARELQRAAKAQGRPWAQAKGFDGAAPLSPLVRGLALEHLHHLELRLWVDGALRQRGRTAAMLNPVAKVLADISASMTLVAGDIVSTGTPAGVGPLPPDAHLLAQLVAPPSDRADTSAPEQLPLDQETLLGVILTSVEVHLGTRGP